MLAIIVLILSIVVISMFIKIKEQERKRKKTVELGIKLADAMQKQVDEIARGLFLLEEDFKEAKKTGEKLKRHKDINFIKHQTIKNTKGE